MADFNIGFVIFPGITQLDFTGPFEVLSRLGTPPSPTVPSRFPQPAIHVIAKTMQPVSSDRGLGIMPTCTFDTAPGRRGGGGTGPDGHRDRDSRRPMNGNDRDLGMNRPIGRRDFVNGVALAAGASLLTRWS